MSISRRRFSMQAAGLALSAGLPFRAWSKNEFQFGAGKVTTLSDGYLTLPEAFVLVDGYQDEIQPVLDKAGVVENGNVISPCHLTLYQDGENNILFDVGAGADFMPTAGKLDDAFSELDITPDDITHVIFTHAHPDHLWGLLDDFDEPRFLNANYYIGADEWAYWTNEDTANTIGEERLAFFAGAQRRLELLKDQIQLFGDGEDIARNVRARASYGHTPGHMSFRISDGDASLVVIGDAIGNAHIAFQRPEIPSGSDQDFETGIATRLAFLEELAAEKDKIVGFHLPNEGVGFVEKMGDAFHFVPAETTT